MKRLMLLFAIALLFVSFFSDVFAAGQIYKKKVFDSFTVSLNTGSLSYQEAPLKGGIAILVGGDAAYWMKVGKLYAANGVAMTWSSKLETTYEPGIDYDTIKAAVSGESTPVPKKTEAKKTSRATTKENTVETIGQWKVTIINKVPEHKRKEAFKEVCLIQKQDPSQYAGVVPVAKKYGITRDEMISIISEGVVKQWPQE